MIHASKERTSSADRRGTCRTVGTEEARRKLGTVREKSCGGIGLKILYETHKHVVHPFKDTRVCCAELERMLEHYDIEPIYKQYYMEVMSKNCDYMEVTSKNCGLRVKVRDDEGSFDGEFMLKYCPFCGSPITIVVLE